MLRNYLKIALRNLVRNRIFTIVNITGLAVGTLCCMYIALYVRDNYSYDKHYDHASDVYRLTTSLQMPGDRHLMASVSPPIAPAMKMDFPEIANFTRAIPTLDAQQHLVKFKDKAFYEKNAFFVDSTFFDVLTYHFLYGRAQGVFSQPNSIVLTEPVSTRLFGTTDPVGQTITLESAYGKHDFLVAGVVDESLGKPSLRPTMFIRMNKNGFGGGFLDNNTWSGNNFTYSYLKLKPGANARALEAKLPAFLTAHAADQLKAIGMQKVLYLQPVSQIHTSTVYEQEPTKNVSKTFLYILSLIAILIQSIACINFMNLSTARASKRAREVGVRKVIGASRRSLIFQFLGESILLSGLGVLIALALLALTIPYLNNLTHADVNLAVFTDPIAWVVIAGLIVFTGLAAGSYPALYLSAFRAIKVIKGNFTSHISSNGIRRSLVVFQFMLSILLITSIVIIYSQLKFVSHKDLGFVKDQQVIFSFNTDDTKKQMAAFQTDITGIPGIVSTSKTNNYPGAAGYNDWQVFPEGGDVAHAVDQQNISTDEHIVNTLGIHLVTGRDFHLHDSNAVIINETLASRLGFNNSTALGKRLFAGDTRVFTVAGVMRDINYRSLRDEVAPFMLSYNPGRDDIRYLIVRFSGGEHASLISQLKSIWQKDLPGTPFDVIFMDEQVGRQYSAETTMASIINIFTMMAIAISCLGLFGLAAFSAEQRSKEIGIRKVLGASAAGIVELMSRDFVKLVFIAFALATPIAWWAMTQWLQSFVYRVSLQWWMFGLSGIAAVIIAIVTVSSQAIRAALANPVKSLKAE